MKIKIKPIALGLMTFLTLMACNKGPKVITSSSTDTESTSKSSGIFDGESSTPSDTNANGTLSNDIHTVVIKEILPATKYDYLKVTEGDEQFWIAIRKQEVKVGETYFYKKALLKTNFESKEHNKVFEKIYLVTSLVQSSHGNSLGSFVTNSSKVEHNHAEDAKKTNSTSNKIIKQEGSIKIADLVQDPKKYEGKTVQITGKCVKVNPNIMNRNWIHIKDGTKDDFDLVITSDKFVPEGSVVTMKAVVTLNKDFGAGYKYDLILENGTIVK